MKRSVVGQRLFSRIIRTGLAILLAGLLTAGGTARAQTSAGSSALRPAVPPEDGKLRIICFGAHPDDCELQVGGTGALWAAAGHHVKFVSLTNGDIGHWREAGGPLALRRLHEVQ